MDFGNNKDDDYFQINALSHGDRVNVGESNMEAITRIELELAFASEKLLNLEMLVMEIARRVTDFDPLLLDNESTSAETVEKAFELDILYGILDSEVKELDNLIISLQMDIKIVEQKVYEEESADKVKAKLDTATVSLQQMQGLIADIRKESAKFEKAIDFSQDEAGTSEAGGRENGHISSHATMQTEDQRRNVLQMLEKSIASELDLEKKLSDSRCIVDELKLKLHHLEQEAYFLEESVETISERMFAAENTSELFLGTSKEIIGKFNAIQFHLSASKSSEDDLKLKSEQSLMKLSSLESTLEKMQEESDKAGSQEADQNLIQSTPESLGLQLQEPEEWLRESDLQLRLAKTSAEASQEDHNILQPDLSTLENSIKSLKDDVSWAESRALNAEVRCMQLSQANIELNEELSSLKSRGSDKASFLERKLKESNTQLEHAKALVDAIVEQQGMLKSTMSDMEHMIEDLKGKVLKAEARAENAESKCTLLTDTNLEHSEELSFLRGRVESLEKSLREANHVKMSTVKDIGIRTKIITDLVKKLALERERLHLQRATLTKNNKILTQKCKGNVNDSTQLREEVTGKYVKLQSTNLPGEIVPDSSSSSQTEVNTTADPLTEEEAKMTAAEEDESAAEDMVDTVRTIDPTPLNWKYIVVAFLVCLAAVLVYFLHQVDDSTV